MKRGDVTGGGDDDRTNEWSKSTHARSDSTPKVEQIYHHREDTSNNHSDHVKYRKRKRQNYANRKSPKEHWKGIQSGKTKNHKSPRKNVHWLVDKFSRSCYIKFWNKLEDFGVSFLITLSLSEGFLDRFNADFSGRLFQYSRSGTHGSIKIDKWNPTKVKRIRLNLFAYYVCWLLYQ